MKESTLQLLDLITIMELHHLRLGRRLNVSKSQIIHMMEKQLKLQ